MSRTIKSVSPKQILRPIPKTAPAPSSLAPTPLRKKSNMEPRKG